MGFSEQFYLSFENALVVPLEMNWLFKSYPWLFGEIGCATATTVCELLTHVLIVTMIAFSLERYADKYISDAEI